MPIVPFSRAPAGLGQKGGSPVPPPMDWTLIAAAQMHSEGRLIDSTKPDERVKRSQESREQDQIKFQNLQQRLKNGEPISPEAGEWLNQYTGQNK